MCIRTVMVIPDELRDGYGIKAFFLYGETLLSTVRNSKYQMNQPFEADNQLKAISAYDGKKYVPLIHIYKDLKTAQKFYHSINGNEGLTLFIKGSYTEATVWDGNIIVAKTFTPLEIIHQKGKSLKIPRVNNWEAFILESFFCQPYRPVNDDQFCKLLGHESKDDYTNEQFRSHREFMWNIRGMYA